MIVGSMFLKVELKRSSHELYSRLGVSLLCPRLHYRYHDQCWTTCSRHSFVTRRSSEPLRSQSPLHLPQSQGPLSSNMGFPHILCYNTSMSLSNLSSNITSMYGFRLFPLNIILVSFNCCMSSYLCDWPVYNAQIQGLNFSIYGTK